ncbi:CAP domain-containing protein [Brevibacillus daliensis]|uniref:CAP domain-containing protein n=1 Tax=Brevibacillus daliensis TaxID=2892995 RepID=UPI001E43650E|nr:CAP domain-containing protein [Brevibacillus daliensis]
MKKRSIMSKTIFSLAIGMAIAGMSTSAFAATPVVMTKAIPVSQLNSNQQDALSTLLNLNLDAETTKKCLSSDTVLSLLKKQNNATTKDTTKKDKNDLVQQICDVLKKEKPSTDKNTKPEMNKPEKPQEKPEINKPEKPEKPETIPGEIPGNKPEGEINPGDKPAVEQPGTDSSVDKEAQEVLTIVNAERAKAGLQPLKLDSKLSKMAKDKAIDMAKNNYFDHNSPTYGSPFDMMDKYGIKYKTAGENIAEGQRNAEEVMKDWMNSSGHRENIMNPSFTTIGIGFHEGYWVQAFTG